MPLYARLANRLSPAPSKPRVVQSAPLVTLTERRSVLQGMSRAPARFFTKRWRARR